jgi:hypothetical protein
MVNFWQNCVLNISFPHLQLPNWLKTAIGFFIYFFSYILSLLPTLPDFDIRATLVITAVGLPFMLDVCTVWFTNPILTTIAHIIDLAASFFLLFYLVDGIFTGFGLINFIIIGISVVWLILHFVWYQKNKFGELSYDGLGKELANYFLDGIMPGKVEKLTLAQINKILSKYMSTVQLVAEKAPIYIVIILFLISAAAIVSICIISGAIDVGREIPASVKIFLPYILTPLALICFVLGILKATDCGTRFILKFKQFIKRWGLRLLMLLLEILYIPVLTYLVDNIIPNRFTCPMGTEPFIEYTNSTFYAFEKHVITCACLNGTDPNTTISEWRLYSDSSLLFVDDVLLVNGGTILFAIVFIMFGIPYLWIRLIKMNREFTFSTNVYGEDIESKWNNIANRLETTGIFLFQKYKIDDPNWSVWLLFAKFIILCINTVTAQFSMKLSALLPLYYIYLIIVTWYKKPYLFAANNFFDIILYFLNAIYSLLPIAASFGFNVTTNMISIISVALIIVPIISCILFLFCRQTMTENPTIITPELQEQILYNEEEEKAEKKRMKKMSKKGKRVERVRDDPNSYSESLSESDSYYLKTSEEEEEFAFLVSELFTTNKIGNSRVSQDWENDRVKIPEGGLESINDFYAGVKTPPFKVCHMMLARRFTDMYKIVDVIIDAQTINMLTKFFNIMVLFAAAAFGWYISAVSHKSNIFSGLSNN